MTNTCYALINEIGEKLNSIKLYYDKEKAVLNMQVQYFNTTIVGYKCRHINNTDAIIVTEELSIKWRIEEMSIL